MRKPQSIYTGQMISILRKRLMEASGIWISSFTHCEALSSLMRKQGALVSAHTIARLFGVLPQRKTYTSTLDIFAQFLGFDSFNHFAKFETDLLEGGLKDAFELFTEGDYSLCSLELAIEVQDWKNMQHLLESVNLKSPYIQDVTDLVGRKVRASSNQSELLRKLNEIQSGRILFYERYVDEDNPNGYFSSAMEQLYLQHASTLNQQVFGTCYLLAKGVYTQKSAQPFIADFQKFSVTVEWDVLTWHEISRFIECQILIDGLSGNLEKSITQHLDLLLRFENSFDAPKYAWILSRSLRALAYHQCLKKALSAPAFLQAVTRCYRQSQERSIAELTLQWVVHAFLYNSEELSLYPLFKLNRPFFENETQLRVMLESATAWLYAQDKEKQLLEKNIRAFAHHTHQRWVFELLG